MIRHDTMTAHGEKSNRRSHTRRRVRTYWPVSFYFSDFPQQELAYYAGAFQEAARTLVRSLRRRGGFSNIAAAPVMFTYRHAIELYLKAIIVLGTRDLEATEADDAKLFKNLAGHKLVPLMFRVERVLSDYDVEWYWPERSIETLTQVRAFVRYVDELDPNSFAFRYPVNTAGERAISSEVEIPFEVLVHVIDELTKALEMVECELDDRVRG